MIIVGVAPPVVVEPPPTGPPPPPEPKVDALRWRWISWTGRSWDLTNWASPVIKLKGASGWGSGEPDHWWQDSPTIDGSSWDGLRIAQASPFMPMMVRAASSAAFLVEHERFIKSLNPRYESTMRVTRPDGSWRERRCRYVSGKDLTMNVDPVKACRAVYPITWSADPFWSGEGVVWTAEYSGGSTFFPGPPFTLAPSQVLGDPGAEVRNVGDVDAYAVWRIDGPFSGFTVGVGSSTVTSTLTLTAGHWVEIDMAPERLTVLDDNGADRWPTLTNANFSSIPPGTSSVETTVNGASAGAAVTLTFTPRYEGAF